MVEIGKGTFSSVYKVSAASAFKQFKYSQHEYGAKGVTSLIEFDLLRSRKHPYLMSAYNVQVTDTGYGYTMPLGFTNLNSISYLTSLSETNKCHLCIKVIMAVAHLHATDVIHRDLKPDNIVVHLDHNGIPQPLVADFGLAQFYIKERERISVDTAFAVYYRAPEHLAGEEKKGAAGQIYRPSSDVWLLVCVCITSCAGSIL